MTVVMIKKGEIFTFVQKLDGHPFTTKGKVLRPFKFYGVNNDNLAVVWIMEPPTEMPCVLSPDNMVGMKIIEVGKN